MAETFSNMVSRVQDALNRVDPADSEDTRAGEWVNETIREDISNAHDWWFLEKVYSLDTAADADVYVLPSQADFKDIRFVLFRKSSTDNWRELTELPERTLFQKYSSIDTAEVRAYAQINQGEDQALRVRGIPDGIYEIEVHVDEYPPILSGTETNEILDRYPRLVESGACARGALFYHDIELHATWTANYSQELRDAVRKERSKDGQRHGTFRMSPAAGRPSGGRRRGHMPYGSAYDWNPGS